MDFKKIISPVILIGLFAAFGVVCLFVWLHKGKKGRWIARKLKLGAAIIAITSISTGCPPPITCYVPAPDNLFSFDSIDSVNYVVIADLPEDSTLTGKIYGPTFKRYEFRIEDKDSLTVDKGNIVALDGNYDQSEEKFKLTINSLLDTGNYQMRFFAKGEGRDPEVYEVFYIGLRIE